MLISDWSSDVCSSDLHSTSTRSQTKADLCFTSFARWWRSRIASSESSTLLWRITQPQSSASRTLEAGSSYHLTSTVTCRKSLRAPCSCCDAFWNSHSKGANAEIRSEAHTSELQSLMRISYL